MMEFCNPYWSNTEKIQLLQRWIAVHSYIYYELNDNVISDHTYDENVKQLLELMKQDPAASKASNHYALFKDFDGSTGFHLYDRMGPSLKRVVEMNGRNVLAVVLKQRNEMRHSESN